jgi:hypothetical protein
MVVMGIRLGASPDGMPKEREYFYSLMLALVLTHVCIVDSKIIGKPLSIFSYWIVFWLYSIAVPVCIIRKRGWSGLKIVIVHFIGLILTQILSSFITLLLVYGI